MKLFKKWKNGMALCLLLVLTLSSCGGAMPENTPPSAQTPEVQTPSLPSDTVTPEEPKVDPAETHQALHEVLMRYLDTYFTDREGYVPCEAVNNVYPDIDDRNTLKDTLGEPHYKGSVYPINKEFLRSVQIYILEDGSIFEVGFGGYKDSVKSVYTGSLQEYLIRISENWTSQGFIVNSDPSETYTMLYEELRTHQYMYISDRKDFIDKEVAKKLWYDSTTVEIEALLGEPHFLQVEEKARPHSVSGIPSEFRFYVLSDGTVLYLQGSIDRSKSGYLTFFNADVVLKAIDTYLYY